MNIKQHDLTIIELFIAVGVIIILAALLIISADPNRRFAEARNAQRLSSANALLTSYLTYMVDHRNFHPTVKDTNGQPIIANQPYQIGTNGEKAPCLAASTSTIAHIDLSGLVDRYMTTLPRDPQGGTSGDSGFYYIRQADNHIVIGACAPERGAVIVAGH